MFCINFCDIYSMNASEEYVENSIAKIENMTNNKAGRIYFGSYFCDRFFLKFKGYRELLQCCKVKNIHATLVIPVFSQNTLAAGKKRISEICESQDDVIDEITVNDPGMLCYIENLNRYKVNSGRLFFKNPRDCRVPEYTDSIIAPSFLSKLNQENQKKHPINCIELDPTNRILDVSEIKDSDVKVAFHSPFCYMTTGRICKFASIHKEIDKKFRPNVNCQMECLSISDSYTGHVVQTNCDPIIYRIGRTLFFVNNKSEIAGKNTDRLIYFPVTEWRKIIYEDIGSGK